MSFSDTTFGNLPLKGVESAFYGLKIIVSELASPKEMKQIRFPKSKRKRIRKKWAKVQRNWIPTWKPAVWQLHDGTFVMDPGSYSRLQEGLKHKQEAVVEDHPFSLRSFLADLHSITNPAPSPLFDLNSHLKFDFETSPWWIQ